MKKDLYRKRLTVPMKKEVLDFLSSLYDDMWIAEEDVIGTEVHDIMLYEQDILNKNEISQILKSLEAIRLKIRDNTIIFDESFEDIHPFIEQEVIKDIGIDIGGKIHTGRSRNDQVAVDLRLKMRTELNKISSKLFNLYETLLKLSEKSITCLMPLYTHFQRAQLGIFSHYINNYLEQLGRSLKRIEEIYKRVNMNPLGACAIGGTNININRKRTMEMLGFESLIYNSIDAISSKDFIAETLNCLTLISLQISRMAEDLLVWSTREFNFVELDDQYCSVSSVMPQKKNPDSLELIRSGCSKVISNSFTGAMMIKSVPTGYLRDFQDLKPLLKSSFDKLNSIIIIFNGIYSTLIIKKDEMLKAIEESEILALDIAEFLVKHYNIPFRQSHEILAQLSKKNDNRSQNFKKRDIEEMIYKVIEKKIYLPENFEALFHDFEKCLTNRKSEGSPSPMHINSNLQQLKERKVDLLKSFYERENNIQKATNLREKRINELILD